LRRFPWFFGSLADLGLRLSSEPASIESSVSAHVAFAADCTFWLASDPLPACAGIHDPLAHRFSSTPDFRRNLLLPVCLLMRPSACASGYIFWLLQLAASDFHRLPPSGYPSTPVPTFIGSFIFGLPTHSLPTFNAVIS
jgi:hypothetical protein